MSRSSFFGVQVAVASEPGDAIRPQLTEVVKNLRTATDWRRQRLAWQQAIPCLRAVSNRVQLGSWDLLREGADEAWREWTTGVEAMATWPEADFGNGSLVLVTLVMLVVKDSNADRTLGDICDLPERVWHRRATYLKLLLAPPLVNAAGVRSSALYVAPHPAHGGFSTSALADEGFDYLTAVE